MLISSAASVKKGLAKITKIRMELTLVQRIVRIRFEEEVLQSNHHRIQVEHGFPVFSKDVQTNVALEVDIWMVDLKIMREGLRVLTAL